MENNSKPSIWSRIWSFVTAPFKAVWNFVKSLTTVQKVVAGICLVGLGILAFFNPVQTLSFSIFIVTFFFAYVFADAVLSHLAFSGKSFWDAIVSLPKALWYDLMQYNWVKKAGLVLGTIIHVVAIYSDPVTMVLTWLVCGGAVWVARQLDKPITVGKPVSMVLQGASSV
jgi:hypothetical protein